MKKIGLCVCYNTKNYGSQLQVLATQLKVQALGYDYEIIRYKKKYDLKMVLKSVPRVFNPWLVRGKLTTLRKKRQLRKYPEIRRKCSKRSRLFGGFIDRFFDRLSPVYTGSEELTKGPLNYDGFLVGSDQLWLPSGLASGFYTLEFVPEQKTKIAYATSFGVGRIPSWQKNRTAAYLKRFDFLSTRELRGAEIIRDLTGKGVQVVADPTLLLTREEWLDVIPEKKITESPYIFCYFLGTNKEHRDIARELKEKTGMPVVTTPFLDNFVKEDLEFGDRQLFDVAPDDFVNLIRGAEYVLTDSFHGSVFSILHHKQFVTFNRFSGASGNSRNSRIDSLCGLLGLEKRRYHQDILQEAAARIDYETVEEKLTALRRESADYLARSLKHV